MSNEHATSSSGDNLRRRTLRGILWVAIEKWGVRLMSLAVFVILLRTISAEAFGLVSFATAVSALLQVLVDSGFAKSLVQKKLVDEFDTATAFWTAMAIAGIVYGAIFFLAPIIESASGLSGLTAVLRVMTLAVFFSSASSVPAALLERDLQFKTLGVRNLAGTFVGAAVAVPMAILGLGVWALVTQTLATIVTATVVLWITSSWKPAFRFSFKSLRGMLEFGLSSMGIAFMNALQSNIDKILVNTLVGAQAGGIYFVAQRGIQLITDLITSVIGQVALTSFSKMQDDRERLNRGFLQLTLASCLVAFPVFSIVGSLADIILPFIAGEDGEWVEAVPLMQIFAISAALTAIAFFDKQTLLAVGKAKHALLLGIVENVVGIALFVLAAPFGVVALAISRMSRLVFVWPYRLWLLKKFAGIRLTPYLKNILTMACAAAISIAAYVVLSHTEWSDIENPFWMFALPVAIIMASLFAGFAWLFCGANNRKVIRHTFGLA